MKQSLLNRCVALAAVAVTVVGCTMKSQEAPDLTGPSEFGQSLTISLTPDVVTQDGASQSVITINARGTNGAGLPNLSLRAEIYVNGVAAGGFGTLSARNIVTDTNGRVTAVYTAPSSPVGNGVVESTVVTIAVTPNGTDFGNSVTRSATLRLVPPGGVVVPPAEGLAASFEFSPQAPIESETVTFDGSGSTPANDSPIVTYSWDFGDNVSATGVTATHAYSRPGQYTVTLSVTDKLGRRRSTSRTITVGLGGAGPTPVFNFSPTAVVACQDVFFNATGSLAGAGRRIASYSWVFGDGTTSSTGPTVTKRYTNTTTRTFNVTLTVTDDLGRSVTSAPQAVTVTNITSTPCS
jgi:PKD repeat protein